LIYGKLRRYLGEIFHELAKRKGVEIVEGHLMPDHIHMCISIPPRYSVSNVVGYLKGKSAIAIARQFKTEVWDDVAPWAQLIALLGRPLISLRLCRRSFNS
jgi:REP element-mobilizing transposase RayT